MINQQWLNTFLTLVDVGHFTQTAERLFMTQPGVSQHIKKLEDQVGVPLLHRTGKRFELTREGEMLYHFGQESREQETKLFSSLQFDDPHQGECRIACSGAMAGFLYPHLLERQKAHPDINIHIEAAPHHKIVQALLANETDLGIVTRPSSSSELIEELLGSESLCLVLPEVCSVNTLTFGDLESLGFVNHPDGFQYAERVLSANFSEQFIGMRKLKVSGYVNQLSQILLPVSKGMGFTVLPETAVTQFDNKNTLTIAALPHTISEPLYLVKKKSRPLASRFSWFEKTIKALIEGQSHAQHSAH